MFHSSKLHVNFVSATLSRKVELLGAKLMKDYKTVGFEAIEEGVEKKDEDDMALSIPKQVQQFFMQVPT